MLSVVIGRGRLLSKDENADYALLPHVLQPVFSLSYRVVLSCFRI